IDTQKDFMDPDGALYVKDAEYIKDNLHDLTEYAEECNIKTINTADYHTDKSKEISDKPDFVNTFPPHCMVNNEGGEFIPETYPKVFDDNYYLVNYNDSKIDEEKFHRARNIIILKDAFDVFAGNKFTDEILMLIQKKQIIEHVIIYGVATNICVKYAVDGLLTRKFKAQLVLDATKALPGYPLEEMYSAWLNKGLRLTTTYLLGKELFDKKSS
ncbi:MAG: cysteine hydrolase family protein, partial [Candidatus Thorarchaeota archaeon]